MYKMWAAGSSFYGDPHTQVKSLGLIKHTTKRTQTIPFMSTSYRVIKYKTNDKWTKVCGCIYLFKIFPDKKQSSLSLAKLKRKHMCVCVCTVMMNRDIHNTEYTVCC